MSFVTNHEDRMYAAYVNAEGLQKAYHEVQLYRVLLGHASAVVYGLTHTAQPALAHRIVVHAFKVMHTFKGRSSFHTWFHQVASNATKMWLRRKDTLAEVSLEDVGELVDTKSQPDQVAVLKDIVHRLPEKDQELLNYKLEGITEHEIATHLKISRSGVSLRWLRLKEKLREMLM